MSFKTRSYKDKVIDVSKKIIEPGAFMRELRQNKEGGGVGREG